MSKLTSSTPSAGRLAKRLFAIRESGMDDDLLLGKTQQTLAYAAATDEGVAEVLAMGIGPFLRPDDYGAFKGRTGSTRSVQLHHKGDIYFYHQGSAAARNAASDDDNDLNQYCEELSTLIRDNRPSEVIVADFQRLVRATDFSGRLLGVLERNVEMVRFGTQTLRPASAEGRLMFNVLALVSDMERDSIVTRLLMGRLARAARGEYPFLGATIPFGYRRQGTAVVPDPTLVETVRKVIQVLGEPNLPKHARARKLADVGLTSVRLAQSITKSTGELCAPVSIAHAADPAGIVDRMYDALTTYRTGVLTFTHRNHVADVPTLMGFDVVGRSVSDPKGWLEIPLALGLPPNAALAAETDGTVTSGWATPDEFEMAAAQASLRPLRGRASHDKVSVLLNLPPWERSGYVYWVASANQLLQVRRRMLSAEEQVDRSWVNAPAGRGRHRREGELVASVNRTKVMVSLANGIATGLSEGVGARVLDGVEMVRQLGMLTRSARRAMDLQRLDASIDSLTRKSNNARRLAHDEDDPEAAAKFVSDMKEFDKQIAAAKAARDTLERSLSTLDFSEGVDAEFGFLYSCLAILSELDGLVAREVASAVGEVIQRLEFDELGDGNVRWSCFAVVSADGEAVELGPFSDVLPNLAARNTEMTLRAQAGLPTVAAEQLTTAFMTQEGTARHIAQSMGLGHIYAVGLIRSGLGAKGVGPLGVCSLPLDAPIELRRVVWEMSNGNPDPAPGYESWVEVLRKTYFGSTAKWGGSWERPHLRRQEFVDLLAERNGGIPWHLAVTLVGGHPRRLFDMTSDRPGELVVALRSGTELNAKVKGSVRLVSCPHRDCDSYATVVKCLPELTYGLAEPTMLLCAKCHRPAVPGAPVFPDWYFVGRATKAAEYRLGDTQPQVDG